MGTVNALDNEPQEDGTMRYEYLQHMTSGDIYAVQLDARQDVTNSFGPIARRDLDHDPGHFAASMTAEDNAWFAEQDAKAGETGAFRLLEGAELAQTIGLAHDPEYA